MVRQFQHTAARRRLQLASFKEAIFLQVSTHSRPKAAATFVQRVNIGIEVSTHSRPKAAAKSARLQIANPKVSTHSRPKAAAQWQKIQSGVR